MEFMDNGGDYFTTAVSQLMHLPETIERMVFDGNDTKRRGKRGQQQYQEGEATGERAGGVAARSYPPVDVLDTPDSYLFYFDVPGLSKSDVQVAVEDETMLLVRGGGGKRKRDGGDSEDREQQSKYLRLERRQLVTKFARKFRLPEDADMEAVSAKCEDGVLIVTVAKKRRAPEAENKSKTVRIEIS